MSEYDIYLRHASVRGGAWVGFLLAWRGLHRRDGFPARPHLYERPWVPDPAYPNDPPKGSWGVRRWAFDLTLLEPPVALDWSGLFSRSAQILGADDERSRAVTPIPSSGAVVSFAGGMPDSGLFPTDAFRRVLNQVIREEGASLLQYYPAGGCPPLRRYLSTYLLRFGLEARPETSLCIRCKEEQERDERTFG